LRSFSNSQKSKGETEKGHEVRTEVGGKKSKTTPYGNDLLVKAVFKKGK